MIRLVKGCSPGEQILYCFFYHIIGIKIVFIMILYMIYYYDSKLALTLPANINRGARLWKIGNLPFIDYAVRSMQG